MSSKESKAAASTLIHMKNTTLNEQEKANLRRLTAPYPGNSSGEADDEYPPVGQKLRGIIGRCSKPIRKTLTNTDLNTSEGRLLMKKTDASKFLVPLLNEDESQTLEKEGIRVTAYDLDENEYPMSFKFWTNRYYVLTSGWNEFHRDKGLANKQRLTLWMFRHVETQKLCFIISYGEVA